MASVIAKRSSHEGVIEPFRRPHLQYIVALKKDNVVDIEYLQDNRVVWLSHNYSSEVHNLEFTQP